MELDINKQNQLNGIRPLDIFSIYNSEGINRSDYETKWNENENGDMEIEIIPNGMKMKMVIWKLKLYQMKILLKILLKI